MIACLFYCIQTPSEKGSTLNGKNFLPKGANSFLLELTPFQKGENYFDRVASPERVIITVR